MAYRVISLRAEDSDVRRFDEGLKAAKRGLMEACEIWENMKQDFQMRGGGSGGGGNSGGGGGGYGQRSYNDRYNGGGFMDGNDPSSWGQPIMISERDWNELQERRRRDSSGRFM